jgi:hypothetical protein
MFANELPRPGDAKQNRTHGTGGDRWKKRPGVHPGRVL